MRRASFTLPREVLIILINQSNHWYLASDEWKYICSYFFHLSLFERRGSTVVHFPRQSCISTSAFSYPHSAAWLTWLYSFFCENSRYYSVKNYLWLYCPIGLYLTISFEATFPLHSPFLFPVSCLPAFSFDFATRHSCLAWIY